MKLFSNPWVFLFIVIVIAALIFLAAKVHFKLDTRWMILSNLWSAGIYPTIRRPPKPEDLQGGDTDNNNPQPKQGDMPIEKTEKSNI
jgi:hypothetical protein